MIIETYVEKTEGSLLKGTFRPIRKGDYELFDTVRYRMVWNSNEAFWDQRARIDDSYVGEISEGCFKFDLGRQYGIHSYQLVYPTK